MNNRAVQRWRHHGGLSYNKNPSLAVLQVEDKGTYRILLSTVSYDFQNYYFVFKVKKKKTKFFLLFSLLL